jgi:hypothetical protein
MTRTANCRAAGAPSRAISDVSPAHSCTPPRPCLAVFRTRASDLSTAVPKTPVRTGPTRRFTKEGTKKRAILMTNAKGLSIQGVLKLGTSSPYTIGSIVLLFTAWMGRSRQIARRIFAPNTRIRCTTTTAFTITNRTALSTMSRTAKCGPPTAAVLPCRSPALFSSQSSPRPDGPAENASPDLPAVPPTAFKLRPLPTLLGCMGRAEAPRPEKLLSPSESPTLRAKLNCPAPPWTCPTGAARGPRAAIRPILFLAVRGLPAKVGSDESGPGLEVRHDSGRNGVWGQGFE